MKFGGVKVNPWCYCLLTGAGSQLKVLYSMTTPGTNAKSLRHIPQAPERILDAPEMLDDYCEFTKTSFTFNTATARSWSNKIFFFNSCCSIPLKTCWWVEASFSGNIDISATQKQCNFSTSNLGVLNLWRFQITVQDLATINVNSYKHLIVSLNMHI